MKIFKNMFGRENLHQMTEEAIHLAKLELFDVQMQKEAALGRERTLISRIDRLQEDLIIMSKEFKRD